MDTYEPTANIARKAVPLTAALAVALGVVGHAHAAAPVTSCLDDGGFDTLRHAVQTAANPSDTIDLSKLKCSKITLINGALSVGTQNLTITGPGAAKLSIDGSHKDRVFKHSGTGTLALSGLTVANGKISAAKAYGGCIYSVGSVVLTGSTVTSCLAASTNIAGGGAVLTHKDLTLRSSTLSQNTAYVSGGQAKTMSAAGGAALVLGQATLHSSTVSGNTVKTAVGRSYAGGLLAFALNSKYSTVSDNEAIAPGTTDNFSVGGGLAAVQSVFMLASTVDHNRADLGGGVFISNSGSSFGTIVMSTISSNQGRLGVGGIEAAAPVSIANSTIAFNTAGAIGAGGLMAAGATAQLQSSIFADNTPNDLDGSASLSGSDNLIKVAGNSANVAPLKNTHTLDPQLGALAFNGGLTRTHALAAGSPAIDAGSTTQADLPNDQRGASYPRVFGVAADIGAVEFDPDHIFGNGYEAP